MIMTTHKKMRISFIKKCNKKFFLNVFIMNIYSYELIHWKSKQIHAPESRVMFIIEHNIGKL